MGWTWKNGAWHALGVATFLSLCLLLVFVLQVFLRSGTGR